MSNTNEPPSNPPVAPAGAPPKGILVDYFGQVHIDIDIGAHDGALPRMATFIKQTSPTRIVVLFGRLSPLVLQEDTETDLKLLANAVASPKVEELTVRIHENRLIADHIFHPLPHCVSLTKLALEFSAAFAPVQELTSYLSGNSKIQQLTLKTTSINETDVESIMSALNAMSSLDCLRLDFHSECRWHFHDQPRFWNTSMLRTLLTGQESLTLLQLDLGPFGDYVYEEIAQGLQKNNTLKTLDLDTRSWRWVGDLSPLIPVLTGPDSNSVLENLVLEGLDDSYDTDALTTLIVNANCPLKSLVVMGVRLCLSKHLQLLRAIQDQPTLQRLTLNLKFDRGDVGLCRRFVGDVAGILPDLKYLTSLELLLSRSYPPYNEYTISEDVKSQILEAVTDHSSLRSLTFHKAVCSSGGFQQQLNGVFAQNLATRTAGASDSFPYGALPLLLAQVKQSCDKRKVAEKARKSCVNTVVYAFLKSHAGDVPAPQSSNVNGK